ncbi:MAG: GGDEF domain-containing protein [Planctomycetota bacterium]|jgi:diguanylate cyclase (GGDEF)-like protein
MKNSISLSKHFYAACGFLIIAVITLADFNTDFRLSFAIFYIFPIVFIARVLQRPWGIIAAVFCFTGWFCADYFSRTIYPSTFVYIWNCSARLFFFLVIAWLERKRQDAFNLVSEMAAIDTLTGLLNIRSFRDTAAFELEHSKRYQRPLSLAYFDLDNFKAVNDKHGHIEGDKVLKCVSTAIIETLRSSDLSSRAGGDEFVVLMPETDLTGAETVMNKLKDAILDKMSQNSWPVTVSIGIVCSPEPASIEEMINSADSLMYKAKNSGKNQVCLSSY